MPRVSLLLCLGALIAAAGTREIPVASAVDESRCIRSGERVIARGAKGVITRRNGHQFACAFDRGRRHELPWRRPSAIGGYHVAFVDGFCEESGCLRYVEVRDLRKARNATKIVSIRLDPARPCPEDASCTANVRKIVVTARGAVAWATCPKRRYHSDDDMVCSSRREPVSIVRVDSRGQRLLDNGPDIRGSSLRLSPSGRNVAWLSGGRTRTARLRGAAPDRQLPGT